MYYMYRSLMVRILINLFSGPTRLSVIKDQISCWSHKSTVHNCRPSCCGCGCAAVFQPRGWLVQLNCTSQPIHCAVPSAASLWHNHLLLPPVLPVSTSPHLTSRDHSIFIQPSLVHADLLPTDEAAVGCEMPKTFDLAEWLGRVNLVMDLNSVLPVATIGP